MNKTTQITKILFIVLISLIAIWSLISLPFSPTAWFDEIYMADYTHNLITTGHLINTLDPTPVDHCIYGPIYFLLTGLTTSIFGFGVITYRIVNLLAFFCCAFLLYKILKYNNIEKIWIYFVTVMFTVDTLNVQNSHSGRMDFVAVTFVLLAYFIYCKWPNEFTWKKTILSSVILTLSVLTTPRVAAIALPIALLLFAEIIKDKKIWMSIVYALIPITLYLIWILIDYGSINAFIDSLSSGSAMNSSNSLIKSFVGGNFKLANYHYIPALFSLILAAYFLYKKLFKAFILFTVPVLSYYLIVKDTGMYAVFVTPFFYFSIGYISTKLNKKIKRYAYIIVCFIALAFNGGIYCVKSLCILSSLSERNEIAFEEWFSKNAPENSLIFGGYEYYYATVNNNCRFFRNTISGEDIDITIKKVKEYKTPDYIVVSNIDNNDTENILKSFTVSKYAEYNPQSSSFARNIYKMLHINITASYSCTIYKVSK